MKTIRIQPSEQENHFLPYPFFINSENGDVDRQDFWKGNPKRLNGFSKKPAAGSIDLSLSAFIKTPSKCIGLFPVFTKKDGEMFTLKIPIESISKD